MSKTEKSQQLLNWLNKEKRKDEVEIMTSKNNFIKEIKKFDKKEFFEVKKKRNNLWKKIRKMIWGY